MVTVTVTVTVAVAVTITVTVAVTVIITHLLLPLGYLGVLDVESFVSLLQLSGHRPALLVHDAWDRRAREFLRNSILSLHPLDLFHAQ